MNLSDLQEKEVIDISTGKRIGTIIDIVISMAGNISKLVLEDRKNTRKLFSKTQEDIYLDWKQIIKIGDDIILVDSKNDLEYYS
ncbi:MAG: YlmC/YmxH family sporulation protein [Bacilli bacterium]|nr:YlmC/YmxH family sporulation protein [Bacilli bacterium]